MKAKKRKLHPKIERLFKALELNYDKNKLNNSFDIRESEILKSDLVNEFRYKNNVIVRLGIACIAIFDNNTEYLYLVGYNDGKRTIECRKG